MRFYVEPKFVQGDRIYIKGTESRHIRDVMRLTIGDEVVAFDGEGSEYYGKIEDLQAREVVVKILRTLRPSSAFVKVTLGVSIPKLDRMDFIVQKSTELGVDTLIPLISERTVVALDEEREQNKLARWRKIAVEASKQCGRAQLPKVEQVTKFSDAIGRAKDYDVALLPTLAEGTLPLKDALRKRNYSNAIIYIGPEGDFTPREVAAAKEAGWICVSLGPLVLRVDTAALAACAVLFYELGGGK